MAVKITVKNGGAKFRAEGMAQAVHFAVCSEGKCVIIVNDGTQKGITTYHDGKRKEFRTVPVVAQ